MERPWPSPGSQMFATLSQWERVFFPPARSTLSPGERVGCRRQNG